MQLLLNLDRFKTEYIFSAYFRSKIRYVINSNTIMMLGFFKYFKPLSNPVKSDVISQHSEMWIHYTSFWNRLGRASQLFCYGQKGRLGWMQGQNSYYDSFYLTLRYRCIYLFLEIRHVFYF